EHLLLLVAEPLELPLDLLARLRRLGFLEGRLEFLEPVVEVHLPLGELLEPAGDLARLALLLFALRLTAGTALFLVAVLVVGQLELIELPLRRPASRVPPALPALTVAVAGDLELTGAEFQQGLVGALLGR